MARLNVLTLVALAVILAVFTACSGGSPKLTSIAVTPAATALTAGATQQFAATGTYSDGSTKDLSTSVTWSSSNTTVATISASGLATGAAAGQTTVTAASIGIQGTTTLTITATAPKLTSIAVTPGAATLTVGATQQFTATGAYSDGSTKDLSTSVTWSSSNTTVATISASGIATGVAAGQTTVTAASAGVQGTTTLTITATAPTMAMLAVTETIAGQMTTLGGATVVVDGLAVGHIGDNSSFSIEEPVGSHQVQILDAGAAGVGSVILTGGQQAITIDASDTEATDVPSNSSIAQVVFGVVNTNDPTSNPLVVKITDLAGHAVNLVSPSAFLTDADGDDIDCSMYVSVEDGGAISVDLQAVLAADGANSASFATANPYQLTVFGDTSDGYPYSAVIPFEAGIYPLQATVTAPPSNAGLVVAGGSITLAKHSSSVAYQVTVGNDGSFSLTGVPAGQYNVSGSFVGTNGITYNVIGTSSISSGVTLTIVPLGPVDIAAGVISVTTSAAQQSSAIQSKQRAPVAKKHVVSKKAEVSFPPSSPYGASIMVSSAAENDVQQASQTYTVPAGTLSADVLYQVCSEEYPYYVLSQSQFNDVWSATALDGSGNVLLNAAASVNEMLSEAPTWQGDGCTTVIDTLASFTSSTSANNITIAVSSVNIGDSKLPTIVQAIVVPSASFTISSFTLDPFTVTPTAQCSVPANVSSNTSNIAVCAPSKGNFLSVPVAGSSDGTFNIFHRPATAKLQYDPNNPVIVTNVELDMVDTSGNILDTLFNGPISGAISQPAPDTLKLDLTYNSGTKASPFTDRTVLPDEISFSLIVSGTQNGGATTTAQNNSTQFNSLVPATSDTTVAGIGRYPKDPLGGGDWATNDTVDWIEANADLLNRFNDISGEHGRNVGHKTHNSGTAIDIFQFDPLSTASGGANYLALAALANKAAAGDGDSQAQVVNWVTTNRSGLDNLFNAGSVSKVYCGLGKATTALPAKWEMSALMTGKLPTKTGAAIDLGVGAWDPAGSVTCIPGHESHHHIQLSF